MTQLAQLSPHQFDQYVKGLVEHGLAPSLAVTAVHGCETLLAAGYGQRALGAAAPATAQTDLILTPASKEAKSK